MNSLSARTSRSRRSIRRVIHRTASVSICKMSKGRRVSSPGKSAGAASTYRDGSTEKVEHRRDTLFQGGCGRFFEGTPEEMHKALTYLGTLPEDTIVYNGHEYTPGNAKFALKIEPDNADVKR
jgi:hypothetical protein